MVNNVVLIDPNLVIEPVFFLISFKILGAENCAKKLEYPIKIYRKHFDYEGRHVMLV